MPRPGSVAAQAAALRRALVRAVAGVAAAAAVGVALRDRAALAHEPGRHPERGRTVGVRVAAVAAVAAVRLVVVDVPTAVTAVAAAVAIVVIREGGAGEGNRATGSQRDGHGRDRDPMTDLADHHSSSISFRGDDCRPSAKASTV